MVDAVAPAPAAVPSTELPVIDWIKAVAIVSVVVTHALSLPGLFGGQATAEATLDEWLHLLVHFCVPAFLFASGVLHAQRAGERGPRVGPRLVRILVPYAIASLVAQLTGLSGAQSASEVVFQLATGASLSIYYFCFLLVVCLLLTWPLERLHPRAIDAVLAALLIVGVVRTLWPGPPESFFWTIRNPLRFYGYFLAGHAAWRHRTVLAQLRDRWAAPALGICLLGIAGYVLAGPRSLAWPSAAILRATYSTSVVGVLALALERRQPPQIVRFLSRASYGVFLYHFFFVYVLLAPTATWPPALRIATRVVAGLVGASAVCVGARRLLGERSRLLVGA